MQGVANLNRHGRLHTHGKNADIWESGDGGPGRRIGPDRREGEPRGKLS